MSELEQIVEGIFVDLSIHPVKRRSLWRYLEELKGYHQATYEHSLRVAILCYKIANTQHMNSRLLISSGLLHDVGKTRLDKSLLEKSDFDEKDMEEMKKHPEYSYEMIRSRFPDEARVVLVHHRTGHVKPYPATLPQDSGFCALGKKYFIGLCSRILSLADFYDAISNRNNMRYGKTKPDPKKRKAIILETYPDLRDLVEKLYEEKVFDNINGLYSK